MTAYRIKFNKGDEVKFIAHLDVMRAFQRAIKRAKLPIGFSKGFNPHQLMSFASPLTLGTTSEGEYVDFEFAEEMGTDIIKDALNAVLPNGFYVESAVRLKEKTDNCMASVEGAAYTVVLSDDITTDTVKKNIDGFLAKEAIVVTKKTKKSCKEVDIKEDILTLKDNSNERPMLYMLLSAGSRRNLKPESVVEGFYNYLGLEFNKYRVSFNRIDMYRRDENGNLVGLSVGVEE